MNEATLYSPAFAALSAGKAMFYCVSYAMPVVAGAGALRGGWSRTGPFTLGHGLRPPRLSSALARWRLS